MLQEMKQRAHNLSEVTKACLTDLYNYIDKYEEIPNLFVTDTSAQLNVQLGDAAENLIINFGVFDSGVDETEDEMLGNIVAWYPQSDLDPSQDEDNTVPGGSFIIKGTPFLGVCQYDVPLAGKSFDEGIEILISYFIENVENIIPELIGMDAV